MRHEQLRREDEEICCNSTNWVYVKREEEKVIVEKVLLTELHERIEDSYVR